MRDAMASFVAALHGAYLDQARHLPVGEQGGLPLLRGSHLTVLAVGVRHLHVLATTSPLPAPHGPEVEISDEVEGLSWTLRFFDPVVAPDLGGIDESDGPRPDAVRQVLGVPDVVYHLSVSPGGGLTPHHAQHAGTGLANQHAAVFHGARHGQGHGRLARAWAKVRLCTRQPAILDKGGGHLVVQVQGQQGVFNNKVCWLRSFYKRFTYETLLNAR